MYVSRRFVGSSDGIDLSFNPLLGLVLYQNFTTLCNAKAGILCNNATPLDVSFQELA